MTLFTSICKVVRSTCHPDTSSVVMAPVVGVDALEVEIEEPGGGELPRPHRAVDVCDRRLLEMEFLRRSRNAEPESQNHRGHGEFAVMHGLAPDRHHRSRPDQPANNA